MPSDAIEVYNVIMSLNNINSVGSDEIPVNIIKCSAGYISLPLSNIINTALASGIFSDALKIGKLVLVYKSGKKCVFCFYRFLQIFQKITKKLYMSDSKTT